MCEFRAHYACKNVEINPSMDCVNYAVCPGFSIWRESMILLKKRNFLPRFEANNNNSNNKHNSDNNNNDNNYNNNDNNNNN